MIQKQADGLRRLIDLATIKTSRLFNKDWYLDRYPDLRTTGVDAARHFLDHGASERRDPSWAFSTSRYLERYPDVASTGVNPLLHYIRKGAAQGRDPKPSVNFVVAPPLRYEPENDVDMIFDRMLQEQKPRNVLEVGTMQALPGVSTHSMARFPWVPAQDYVRLDLFPGPDVDVVGDLHALPAEWSGKFDCFVASAVFEHLERPWVAAREVSRILAPGGLFYVGTHQCFPLHAHPHDYFRFSREALRLVLEDAGLVVEAADYKHRCVIVPPEAMMERAYVDIWNAIEPAYILVYAAGRKKAL